MVVVMMMFSLFFKGQMLGDRGDSGNQEGASRQAIQEQRTADNAASRPSKCCVPEALLLFNN